MFILLLIYYLMCWIMLKVNSRADFIAHRAAGFTDLNTYYIDDWRSHLTL